MRNGRYNYAIEMKTPLGLRRGNLELIVEGKWINGYLTMFTKTYPIRNGHFEGNRISFEGEMKTLMNMLPYKAEGSIKPTSVEIVITTSQGAYPVSGEASYMGRRWENV